MVAIRFSLSLDHDLLLPAALRARAAHCDPARAAELLQPVRAHELLERIDLLRRADYLEHDRVGAEVGDAGVEDLRERDELRPLRRRRRDLQERELALDALARHELAHAEHV